MAGARSMSFRTNLLVGCMLLIVKVIKTLNLGGGNAGIVCRIHILHIHNTYNSLCQCMPFFLFAMCKSRNL